MSTGARRVARLLHVAPTWFDESSVIGGAERYTLELARACASRAATTLVSFAASPTSSMDGPLRVRLMRALPGRAALAGNPLLPALYGEMRDADVVHCHQPDTLVSNAVILAGAAMGKRVFVSDLGGGHMYAPSLKLSVLPRATGLLLLSEYSRRLWARAPVWRRPPRTSVIYGGVDTSRFAPGGAVDRDHVLFVGRLMRHKGVEHVIDAVDAGSGPLRLTVAGRPYDADYVTHLRARAAGRPVTFRETVADEALPALYQSALVTVMPSVYRLWGGGETEIPELLGLVALESMACGTPVIVSDVASLPELVEDGATGFVVPPNDPRAIRRAIDALSADPARRDEMGRRARASVEARYTWAATAARCFEAYES